MSYCAVIESVWCKEKRIFSLLGLDLVRLYGQSRFET